MLSTLQLHILCNARIYSLSVCFAWSISKEKSHTPNTMTHSTVCCCAQRCESHWVFAKWVGMSQVSLDNYKQTIREFPRLSQDHFQLYILRWEVTVREGAWEIIYKLDWTCTLKRAWNTDTLQWWKTKREKACFRTKSSLKKKSYCLFQDSNCHIVNLT